MKTIFYISDLFCHSFLLISVFNGQSCTLHYRSEQNSFDRNESRPNGHIDGLTSAMEVVGCYIDEKGGKRFKLFL